MLKVDEKFLYVLLTLSQEQNIKTGRFSMIYADEVVVSHTIHQVRERGPNFLDLAGKALEGSFEGLAFFNPHSAPQFASFWEISKSCVTPGIIRVCSN